MPVQPGVRLGTELRVGRRIDAEIESLAALQHGIVTRAQLIRRGVAAHRVDQRVRTGRLRRVHAGVYRVGFGAAPLSREMAAVLACSGPGAPGAAHAGRDWLCAVIGFRSAAVMHNLLPAHAGDEVIEVIVSAAVHRGRRAGVRAHRMDLRREEVQAIQGIPITTPARTLVDLAGISTPRELERAVAVAERHGAADRRQILTALNRRPHGRGAARLRALLQGSDAIPYTRSVAEETFLDLLRAGGLPLPAVNATLHGFEVDFYWPQARLVVEIDGFAYHVARRSFLRDRQKNSTLAAAGIQVLRLGWEQIAADRDRTLVQVAQVLARTT